MIYALLALHHVVEYSRVWLGGASQLVVLVPQVSVGGGEVVQLMDGFLRYDECSPKQEILMLNAKTEKIFNIYISSSHMNTFSQKINYGIFL